MITVSEFFIPLLLNQYPQSNSLETNKKKHRKRVESQGIWITCKRCFSVYICMLVPSRCRLCSCRQHNRHNNMSPHTHAHILLKALTPAPALYTCLQTPRYCAHDAGELHLFIFRRLNQNLGARVLRHISHSAAVPIETRFMFSLWLRLSSRLLERASLASVRVTACL